METDESTDDKAMGTDKISDSIMEVDSIFGSQEDEEFAQSVSLQMSEHFHTVRHSGTSARTESLIDRFYENAANFDPLVYGMLRVIHWTAELANRFNFESPQQAVIATELFFSTWDDVFAKPQSPGIFGGTGNSDAWQKILEMDLAKFEEYSEYVYDSVSSALFN